jgi:hypothetical protein
MTKVYWPRQVQFYLLILIGLAFYMPLIARAPKSFNGLWIFAGVLIFFAGRSLLDSFQPMWAYGEKGIEIYDENGNVTQEYKWEDVLGIEKHYWGSRVKHYCPVLDLKNDKSWQIWPFWTRNYRTVVKEVIGFTKKNSNAHIDPWVEKQTKFWTGLS